MSLFSHIYTKRDLWAGPHLPKRQWIPEKSQLKRADALADLEVPSLEPRGLEALVAHLQPPARAFPISTRAAYDDFLDAIPEFYMLILEQSILSSIHLYT